MIIKFILKDLVKLNDVVRMFGFKFFCEVFGINLIWIWKYNGREIINFYGMFYFFCEDGILIG